jgi:hypothetical protein
MHLKKHVATTMTHRLWKIFFLIYIFIFYKRNKLQKHNFYMIIYTNNPLKLQFWLKKRKKKKDIFSEVSKIGIFLQ